MTIFDFLTMLGSLSLFLFGMSVMGTALEKRAGGSLKAILAKLTSGRFSGLLTGLAVTAVIQSSSATTVMVVGFVNSGLLSLRQSIPVIMGANIGTTVTAWLLSLSGISGDSLFLQLLKPSSFTPVLAVIGIILYLTGKGKKKDTGLILLGFATLMFGMESLSGSVSGLRRGFRRGVGLRGRVCIVCLRLILAAAGKHAEQQHEYEAEGKNAFCHQRFSFLIVTIIFFFAATW